MRIVLLTTIYPPANTEGIPRQRQVLASELARRGHAVHVLSLGADRRVERAAGVWVHTLPVPASNSFSASYPAVDLPLTYSQILYEGLREIESSEPVDIVDTPLWAAQGLVSLCRHPGPRVLTLQTMTEQIVALSGARPSAGDLALMALEQLCLGHAQGLLADSGVALEAARRAGAIQPVEATAVVPHGLPPLPLAPEPRPPDGWFEVLMVGRLERRKGTPFLFEHLPAWLDRIPSLRVRFVGRDNSSGDGWLQRHGSDYPSYFRQHHPGLAGRVTFDGYVTESQLALRYAQADVVLVPSLYESFGLVYLEAMRSRRPVVTFAVGAAEEIFPRGEDDGAVLVPPNDWPGLVAALETLASQPALRADLGRRGHQRFLDAFTAAAMGAASLAFYERVRGRTRPAPRRPNDVYQVMEALDEGDAVSTIARRNAALLAELGQPRAILARFAHPAVAAETRSLESAPLPADSGVIFHYWGYNTSTDLINNVHGRKALYFHNVTPPTFFAPDTDAYRSTTQGYDQLRHLAQAFDLLIGVSSFNLQTLRPLLTAAKPALVLPPIVDSGEIHEAPYDERLLAQLRQPGVVNWLFVGRLARNKRPERLMLLFDHYYREINRHAQLWLVGNASGDRAYTAELERLRCTLASGSHIALVGKVPDEAIRAYYRAAHIFVSASEHEGFGLPLIEAMAFDVPVLAYAAAAVPETMGAGGLLIQDWDPPRLAELVHVVTRDRSVRDRLLAGQRANLSRFSPAAIRPRLAAALRFLQTGDLMAGELSWVEPC